LIWSVGSWLLLWAWRGIHYCRLGGAAHIWNLVEQFCQPGWNFGNSPFSQQYHVCFHGLDELLLAFE
jgi:hypothetical protein